MGSTNGPSRSRTTDTNKSKGGSSKSGAVKPKGSTNGPSRG